MPHAKQIFLSAASPWRTIGRWANHVRAVRRMVWSSSHIAILQLGRRHKHGSAFYLHCIASNPIGIRETTNQFQPIIFQNGALTTVQSSATITTLLLFASDGKLIERWNPNSTAFTLPTSLPAGLYVLQVNTASGNSALKMVLGQ